MCCASLLEVGPVVTKPRLVSCTYRNCHNRPTHRVVWANPGEKHWHGCTEHLPGMVKAGKLGGNSDAAADLVKL